MHANNRKHGIRAKRSQPLQQAGEKRTFEESSDGAARPCETVGIGSVSLKVESGRRAMMTASKDQYARLCSQGLKRTTLSQRHYLLNKEHKDPISKTPVKRKLSHIVLRGTGGVFNPFPTRGDGARRLGNKVPKEQ